MTAERWQKIKDLLANVLELAPEHRAAYLDQSCYGDDSLRRDIELLLQHEIEVGSHFLDQTALAGATAELLPEEKNPWIGRRVGAYQIMEQIGAGGMGEVYRAFRADEQYSQQVALKVIRAGQDSSLVITRFKNERQILASLDHPNIAGLLDGGTTAEGTPYLVMELIKGQPIGDYCDAHRLTIAQRLRLFAQVCAAVQYAHQRLIIHRDIKPGNILVTEDRTPKLLDFGIAKVLGADLPVQRDETLTAFRALTPEYASPEQVKGEPVTTASDVYSLGVVLYDLLTGHSPYPATTRTSHDLAAAICTREAEKPSAMVSRTPEKEEGRTPDNIEQIAAARGSSPHRLQKQLSGDLDNIVLMALRKEPERRYASAEQFAADLLRHLENVPVFARKDTAAYRASKFIGRHKVAVLAFTAVLVTILGGLAVSLYEARLARQQAEIARAQRARAERRFNDVRKLANSLMFEIHDSIRDLPGATRARQLLVNQALEYLDSLSHEASGDAALQRELAAAYDRVGDVLGYNGAANLGDFGGAIKSYGKALTIREALAAANPNDLQIQTDLFSNYFRLSFALQNAGDNAAALSNLQKAVPLAQRLASTSSDLKWQDWLAGVHWQMANILSRSNELAKALDEYRAAVAIREPVASNPAASASVHAHLAADYNGIGEVLARTGDTTQAVAFFRKALKILEELSRTNPNDATFREYLGETFSFLQSVLQKQGQLDESLECGLKASRIFKDLAAQDATNSLAAANMGFSEIGIGETLVLKARIRQAIPHLQHAMNLFESGHHKTPYDIAGLAESYSTLAMAHKALAEHETDLSKKAAHLLEARAWLQKSVRTWQANSSNEIPDPLTGRDLSHVQAELARCDALLAKL